LRQNNLLLGKFFCQLCTVVWKVERAQILKLFFSTFYELSTSEKRQKGKIISFCFYIATFEHSLNCGKTAKFEFLEQDCRLGN
jgi:hypothetical protein